MKIVSVYAPLERGAQYLAAGILRAFSKRLILAFFAISTLVVTFPRLNRGVSFISDKFFNEKVEYIKVAPLTEIVVFPSYHFGSGRDFFGGKTLARIHEFSKEDFTAHLLSSIPSLLRKRAANYLPALLEACEKYQVDPFWALAVMWTESHFNINAESRVKAQGLMQVMPATAGFIMKLKRKNVSNKQIAKKIRVPKFNIDLGVFYLKRLQNIFRGSYRYATVAYNMGPNGVKRRLLMGKPVGVKNNYLDSVRGNYRSLWAPFVSLLQKKAHPYKSTYVVKRKPVTEKAPWDFPFMIERKLELYALR